MKLLNKTITSTLIGASLILLYFSTLPVLSGLETEKSNEVLVFLEDIFQLDMSQYEPTLIGTVMGYPSELGGISQLSGKYTLESKRSELDILFKFRNDTLSWCYIRVIEGKPLFTQDLNHSVSKKAQDFLQRYQTFSQDLSLDEMKNVLTICDIEKSTTKRINNIKLDVMDKANSTTFKWSLSLNGADFTSLNLRFSNGYLVEFRDDRSYYRIGGTDVRINKSEAVDIALNYVKDFSWIIDNEEITDFNVVEEKIGVELLTRSREPLKLYPYWLINLPFDDLYPGNVYGISIAIWADTAEVIQCNTLVFGGNIISDSSEITYKIENSPQVIALEVVLISVVFGLIFLAIVLHRRKMR